jgi:hypothetical protein
LNPRQTDDLLTPTPFSKRPKIISIKMTSYNELVNIEIGKSTTYGSNFRLSRQYSIELAKFLKEQVGKRESFQLMRVYIAGCMETENTHLGLFTAGY